MHFQENTEALTQSVSKVEVSESTSTVLMCFTGTANPISK